MIYVLDRFYLVMMIYLVVFHISGVLPLLLEKESGVGVLPHDYVTSFAANFLYSHLPTTLSEMMNSKWLIPMSLEAWIFLYLRFYANKYPLLWLLNLKVTKFMLNLGEKPLLRALSMGLMVIFLGNLAIILAE